MKKAYYYAMLLSVSSSIWLTAHASAYTVNWQGALKAVHSGDTSGKVDLQTFANKTNLYALGPVADLDGEITVIADSFSIARVREGSIKTDHDLDTQASFLVWAEVAAWQQPTSLSEKVENLSQLQTLVEEQAKKAGIDTSQPFPFLLEGLIPSVEYHVLAPKTQPQGHNTQQDNHTAAAKNISAENTKAKILGFFSKTHQGVFTHRDSFIHLHILEDNGSSGHIDALAVNADTRITFPQ
ncbi:hypothetical protein [Thiothrix eikelboomii]|uniref:hypothetical protein n=1 Tax=Thiothrix eikelboomii TaxID=92487 RepID=UPI003BB05AC1